MVRTYLAFGMLGIILANGAAFAANEPFTGEFQGHGRQCYGKLFVLTKTIEWHTPFVACKKTPYEVISKNLDAAKPEIAFLLKPEKSCGFAVITLDWDPEYPDYWNATGYRSLDAYKQNSDDRLNCGVEKLSK
jgi:hypothetical protein